MKYAGVAGALLALLAASTLAASVTRTEANNGNLVMEDVPEIPAEIVDDLNRYQNVRFGYFEGWQDDGDGVYIVTRFADVEQLHRVDAPGGARHQLTYYGEPIGDIAPQPQGNRILFTRDAGGSEFAQVFLLDPATGVATMLTDGESRNGAVAWDRQGRRIAYQSTARNGASNDIWIMDPEDPDTAEIVVEAQDGSWWGPVEFSARGNQLLAMNYVSITDSSAHLVDLDSGTVTLLAGGAGNTSTNYPVAFDDGNDGFWLITSQGSEFQRLAWQPAESGADAKVVTGDIDWDISDAVISRDRKRMAFVVNENGRSAIYLLDPRTREHRRIDTIPTGVAARIEFSPDGRKLAMTLNTATTPSDTFVLELGDGPLDYGPLIRWTFSEVGGLDTTAFREPTLISYPRGSTSHRATAPSRSWSRSTAARRPSRGRGSPALTRCGWRSSALPSSCRTCGDRPAMARPTSGWTTASGARIR